MESFFSTLKTERTARKVYRTRNEARGGAFDDIERFYNPRRRHSKPGHLSPMEFEARAMLAQPAVHKTGSRSEGQVLMKLMLDVQDESAFCEMAKADGLYSGKIDKAGGYEFDNAKEPSKNAIKVSNRAFRE